MQIFFALSVPVDISDKNVALTVYFEANYGLPTINSFNASDVEKRSIDRAIVYEVLENNFERYSSFKCMGKEGGKELIINLIYILQLLIF